MSTVIDHRPTQSRRPRSHRIPTVGVNLLPPEVVQVRRGRRIRRTVFALLAVVLVLLGAWYANVRMETDAAHENLADAKAETVRLNRQQNEFTELRGVQSEIELIDRQLAQLMANDMGWADLVAALRQAAPAGMRLTSINVALDASRVTGGSRPDAAAAPLATLTVTGAGLTKQQIADYVDALGRIDGVADAFITSVTTNEEGLEFNVRATVTEALLGGRFASPSPKAGK